MDLISYAQNFEDVMLWRALSKVEHGFFIDVGAQDPIVDSVSMLFRERGWRGIHLEPTPHYAELLRSACPSDIVIQAAVADTSTPIYFFEIPGGGISTADTDVADQHKARGIAIQEIVVPSVKLSAVFDLVSSKEIHWLKIDVEGFERQVLSSWGKSSARPWIVIVESTLPLTQIETHKAWEPILLSYGYQHAYFDGLNRYYVSDSHTELISAFHAPPNVFDNFMLNGTSTASFHKRIVSRFEESSDEAATRSYELKAMLDARIAELQSRHASDTKRLDEQALQIDNLSGQLMAKVQALATLQESWSNRERGLSADIATANAQLKALFEAAVQREREISSRMAEMNDRAAHTIQEAARDRDRREAQIRDSYESERAALHAIANQRVAEAYEEVLKSHQRVDELHGKLAEQAKYWNEERALLIRENAAREAESRKIDRALTDIQNSFAWKLTAPIRLMSRRKIVPPEHTLKPIAQIAQTRVTVTPNSGVEVLRQSEDANTGAEYRSQRRNESSMNPPAVASLDSLLQYEDGQFVDQAYRTLLRREPDLDGRSFYVNRLRTGTSKLKILRELFSSAEGRLIAANVPGLPEAIRLQRLYSIPVIGLLFRLARHRDDQYAIKKDVRALELRFESQVQDITRRVSSLEGRSTQQAEPSSEQLHSAGRDNASPPAVIGKSVLEKHISLVEDAPLQAIDEFKSAIRDSRESRLLRPRQN